MITKILSIALLAIMTVISASPVYTGATGNIDNTKEKYRPE